MIGCEREADGGYYPAHSPGPVSHTAALGYFFILAWVALFKNMYILCSIGHNRQENSWCSRQPAGVPRAGLLPGPGLVVCSLAALLCSQGNDRSPVGSSTFTKSNVTQQKKKANSSAGSGERVAQLFSARLPAF